ncbi:MAG: tRNA lysidine(34) synthetase TilS [Halarcobacter sp.]
MQFETLEINTTKNLLAFSAGLDSTALFFILLENNIPFDIAIVNYNVREQSKDEVKYAKDLAKKYDKQIFVKNLELKELSNFEKKARDIRYNFFEEIIQKNSYEALITAHQLNDKLEWFLMQLSQGAGLIELIGLNKISQKNNYTIYRPLLDYTKKDLQAYLDNENIKYFIDESNFDEKYRRNYFRKNFSNSFLEKFQDGVKKSFEYLQNDLDSLNIDLNPILNQKELKIFKAFDDDNLNIRIIDKDLKKRGFLLTKKQRDEIIKQKEIVVSHKISITITSKYIYICPFETTTMPKEFKELCRINKIPKNIRAYLYINSLFESIKKIL